MLAGLVPYGPAKSRIVAARKSAYLTGFRRLLKVLSRTSCLTALSALWLGACHPRLVMPDLQGPFEGRQWPEEPDEAHVRHVGSLVLPHQSLARPIAVACAEGRVAVADPLAGAAFVLDLDRKRWRLVRPPRGAERSTPTGVGLLSDGTLLIVDAQRRELQSLPPKKGRRAIPLLQDSELVRPTAIEMLNDSEAVLVDTGGHQLYLVNIAEGSMQSIGPGRGLVGEGFNFPVDAAPSEDGSLYVSDGLNAVIQRLSNDSVSLVAGGVGLGGPALIRPKGLAVDTAGRLHVVDAGMQHVQVYGADGSLAGRYGGPGPGEGSLALPAGICIESNLVYVADSLNRRVQVYSLVDLED